MAEANRQQGGNRGPFGIPSLRSLAGPMGRFRRGPVEKPKSFPGTMKRLWVYLGRERRLLGLILLFALADAAVVFAAPYLIGKAIDAMAANGGTVDFRLLEAAVLVLGAIYLTEWAVSFLQGWLMAGVSQRVVKRLRQTLFGKLQKLPLSYFDSRPHGEIMSRVTNDIDNVSTTISQSTVQLMSGAIALAGSLTMMLVLSPLLTLASLITVPLVFGLARTVTRRTRLLFKEQQDRLGRLNGHIEETISGIEVVKGFNREENVIDAFEKANAELYRVEWKAQIWSGFLMPLLSVINNLGLAAIAIVGGALAVKGGITVGAIASFLSYSRQFVRPLNELANLYNMLQAGVAGAERAFAVLDEPEEPPDPPNAVPLTAPKGHVVFENVSFGYRPDVPVLKKVCFEAPAGSSTALVGPTGAGKTTLVNLLTRFYDPTEGRILIDGRDIREYTRDSLRRCFGIVLQDNWLFAGTIRENIKYGKPDATDEEMKAAAAFANADKFIERLPKGYDTVLAENGDNLSQGQRQLLALARVILANPPILILDEATSSIDTRTELHIQSALLRLMKGRTCFIIAHRLNTVRGADTILVIDGGRIVEQGGHETLMKKGGIYRRMFENQFKNMEEGGTQAGFYQSETGSMM